MTTKRIKFEDELKDLEEIVNRIDSGELTLEESIGAFERGVALVKSLNHKLDEVERKVELLTRNAEGELQRAPFDNDQQAGAPGGGAQSGGARDSGNDDDEDPPF
ncbi:MAG TPA: exodeoxyribonuclease VII small subunit [Candidatus Binataceae bacterium]|jgi:exodeoxyribonuclease VII small subunit